MAFLEDVADYITAQIPALVQGEILFASEYPDEPAEIVTIYQFPGNQSSKLGDNRSPGLQVRSRAANYPAALALLDSVYDILDPIGDEFKDAAPGGVKINGTTYLSFISQQEAIPLGEDTKGRHELSQNYIVTYVP